MAIFDDYISLKQAADISGYHSDYIGALVRSGKVSGKKIGNRWTVSEQEIKNHFSKKHYVSADRAFFSKKAVAFGIIFVLIAGAASVLYLLQGNASQVTVRNTLNDVVNLQAPTAKASTVTADKNAAAPVIIQQP